MGTKRGCKVGDSKFAVGRFQSTFDFSFSINGSIKVLAFASYPNFTHFSIVSSVESFIACFIDSLMVRLRISEQ